MNDAQNRIDNLERILKSKEEEAEMVKTKVSKILEMGDTQLENENLRVSSFIREFILYHFLFYKFLILSHILVDTLSLQVVPEVV